MILSKEQRKEFHEAAKPLLKFMNDNCHPHCRVIVDSTQAELVEGVASVIDESFLKD